MLRNVAKEVRKINVERAIKQIEIHVSRNKFMFTVICVDDTGSSSKTGVSKEDFNLLKVVGRGAYGKVFMVSHKETG